MPATIPVRVMEATTDDRNGCRRNGLRNDEETRDINVFFSWGDGNPLGPTWVDEGAQGLVWSALDILGMLPSLREARRFGPDTGVATKYTSTIAHTATVIICKTNPNVSESSVGS